MVHCRLQLLPLLYDHRQVLAQEEGRKTQVEVRPDRRRKTSVRIDPGTVHVAQQLVKVNIESTSKTSSDYSGHVAPGSISLGRQLPNAAKMVIRSAGRR